MITQLSVSKSFLSFWRSGSRVLAVSLVSSLLVGNASSAAPFQIDEEEPATVIINGVIIRPTVVGFAQEVEVPQEAQQSEDKPETDDSAEVAEVDTSDSEEKEEIGDRFIRFHMWDGSIVGGEVSVDQIEVETEFGTLAIPIEKILKFSPGLDSLPVLNEQLSTLVENLGDKNFDTREQAHRELISMGALIRNAIDGFSDGGSAERKKHLEDIKKQFGEMAEDFEATETMSALVQDDTVVTEHFTIVGKIKQDGFTMGSKFGELNIKLTDIKLADRTFNMARQEVRKSVEVDSRAFFQTEPLSTKIRVNRGDKISIRATGTIEWKNWNTSCGPGGQTSQGQWEGINSGALAARIGKTGKYVEVGAKGDFVAKESGVLYLGIAMQDNYARNSSYRWEGNYSAKISVQPTSK